MKNLAIFALATRATRANFKFRNAERIRTAANDAEYVTVESTWTTTVHAGDLDPRLSAASRRAYDAMTTARAELDAAIAALKGAGLKNPRVLDRVTCTCPGEEGHVRYDVVVADSGHAYEYVEVASGRIVRLETLSKQQPNETTFRMCVHDANTRRTAARMARELLLPLFRGYDLRLLRDTFENVSAHGANARVLENACDAAENLALSRWQLKGVHAACKALETVYAGHGWGRDITPGNPLCERIARAIATCVAEWSAWNSPLGECEFQSAWTDVTDDVARTGCGTFLPGEYTRRDTTCLDVVVECATWCAENVPSDTLERVFRNSI